MDFIIKILKNHRHLKHMITFPKRMGLGPKPITGNVIPWFKVDGEVGPASNSAIQTLYRLYCIKCLQKCKCHWICIMYILLWMSNNVISDFSWFFSVSVWWQIVKGLLCFLAIWLELLYLRKHFYWFKAGVFV